MTTLILSVLFACGKQDVTYVCAEEEVLQECDENGENCIDYQDCAADELECHAEMGHCMASEEDLEIEEEE